MILKWSHDLMTSAQTLPTAVQLISTISVTNGCNSVSQHDIGIYVGIEGGVDLVPTDGETSRVISIIHDVNSVCLYDNEIYVLVFGSDGWSVRVYDSDYQLSESWGHNDRCEVFNQMVVRDERVLVPNRDRKTIVLYGLAGEVERSIPCFRLTDADTWLCGSSPCHNAVIVSCDGTVSRIEVSTGHCVWSTDSLERPTAVCCDGDDRGYVSVGGYINALQIAVLRFKTGETASFLVGVCLCFSNACMRLPVPFETCRYQSAPDSDCPVPVNACLCLSVPPSSLTY